jgi:hypothetical protein
VWFGLATSLYTGKTVKAEVLGSVVLVLRVYRLGSVIFVEGWLSCLVGWVGVRAA